MVSESEDGATTQIVAKPNLSASWAQNKQLLIFLSIPSLGAGLFFASLGAWPILPFAGLEITAFGGSLYYVHWKLHFRHIVTIKGQSIRIDKGVYAPKFTYSFDREETGLAIRTEAHPWDGPEIHIQDKKQSVRVGEFLNREDCLVLQQCLSKHLRIVAQGPIAQRKL